MLKKNKVDKYSIDNTDYTVGQDNVQKWGFDVHNPVFGLSAGFIVLFVISLLCVDPATAKAGLDSIKWSIISHFDSLFMWSGNFFLLFCLFLVFSPFGKIRIGGKNADPEYSTLSWIAMLFAAGMGIGLLFWGVSEPLAYFTGWYETPLGVEAYSPEAVNIALGATIYHWGFSAWAMYAIVGLALAIFYYNKGLPLSMRSIFYPILGDRAWGWFGHCIDILAVLATIFGLAPSLGLGAQQVTGGINYVFGTHGAMGMQMVIIVFVTILATISVIRGIDGGVKVISNINIIAAAALLIFVFFLNIDISPKYIMAATVGYIDNFLALSNPYGRVDEVWMHGWTVFYWAWWISWSPFVGMFIARVSKGRSIREFLLAVIIIPTIVTLVWMGVFGGAAIDQTINKIGEFGAHGLSNVSLALFELYDSMPFSILLSLLSILLIMVFFVTSADSGSLVINSITAGGKIETPVPQRIFWAVLEGVLSAALLYIGGADALQALQAGVIMTALPFTIILIIMCFSLLLGLRTEER